MIHIRGKLYPMSKVNLDALIKREDMFVEGGKESKRGNDDFRISDLEQRAFFFHSLRKPDFQRETSDWTPEKIYEFIQSFVDGDLIPAIIMWNAGSFNFVIDGAHRISALMAWVLDDYGDGILSKPFFDGAEENIIKFHKKTKALVDSNVGSYQQFVNSLQSQNSDKKTVETALRLATLNIKLQWVEGNAETAETSFFKINESATPINETEKRLLKSRKKPNSIAARAIIHAGAGHKYWRGFQDEPRLKIEETAKEINELLFTPKLVTPIKTLDVPIAGKGYSAQTLELIMNMVNFSNSIKLEDPSKKKKSIDPELEIPDDQDGSETLKYLLNTKRGLSNITGNASSSLGLHPAIYFYSAQGRYQVTAFMAILELIKDYETRRQLVKFTKVRGTFEAFLWKYKSIVNQSQVHYGSGIKGYRQLAKLFDFIIVQFIDGKGEQEIINALDINEEYKFFKPELRELDPQHRKDFSTESKSEVFIRSAISTGLHCTICNGYIHMNSTQVDHKTDKKYGGVGNADNGQITHPYCNSIKDVLIKDGFITTPMTYDLVHDFVKK